MYLNSVDPWTLGDEMVTLLEKKREQGLIAPRCGWATNTVCRKIPWENSPSRTRDCTDKTRDGTLDRTES
nr:DUF4921 family protein [Mobiluncus curtisii]